jgi:uncharacterized protein
MLKLAVALLATSYLSWYLERFETKMVYPFDATYASPETAGEPRLAESRFPTQDGEMLVVWQAKAAPGRPTLLYLPGNAGGLKDRAQRFSRLIDRGYGVVALAYRGSSGSTGAPEEAALTADALALARAITARPLVLYGESLGTAVAIKLAAGGIGDALVLEAPFTSLIDLVAEQYPMEKLDHLMTQRWDSGAGIGNVRQPLLVVHGVDDKLVPIGMGRQIFQQARSDAKTFVEVSGRGHNGLWTVEMQSALYTFLDTR